MANIVIVPGLAVRAYAAGPAAALAARGHRVELTPAPAWRGQPTDLDRFGRHLATRFDIAGRNVDLLIGLSVGTQAAAVAAAQSNIVSRLLLVSPTVDPPRRSRLKLIKAWMIDGDDNPKSPGIGEQIPDWAKAGPRRIYRGLVSATRVHLEEVLMGVTAPTTVVHADSDRLSPLEFAAMLAEQQRAELLIMPNAPHSWPIADDRRFCALVDQLLSDRQKGEPD